MIIEHFDRITDVLQRLKDETSSNPLDADSRGDQYEWIDWGDEDGGRIMPSLNSLFISPYLYRGQTERHSPCLPKLYRRVRDLPLASHPQQLFEKERDFYLLQQVRLQEFFLVLEQHPAVEFTRKIGLHLSQVALAQHYGIATDRLDLTQDPDVATFFATNTQDQLGVWYPVSEGIGLVYRFDLTVFPRTLGDSVIKEFFRCVEMIGLQTFPRPGEQKAWTIRLPLGFDFERLPLDVFTFNHDKEVGRMINERFDGGKRLFPSDILSEVAMAINELKSVPIKLVRKVLTDHDCRPEMLDDALNMYSIRFKSQFGVEVTDREPITLSFEQITRAITFVELKGSDFLRNVGVRGVKIKHIPTLIDLLSDHREWNRATAAEVLGELGKDAKDALPALHKALRDESKIVCTAVALAIKQIKEHEANLNK